MRFTRTADGRVAFSSLLPRALPMAMAVVLALALALLLRAGPIAAQETDALTAPDAAPAQADGAPPVAPAEEPAAEVPRASGAPAESTDPVPHADAAAAPDTSEPAAAATEPAASEPSLVPDDAGEGASDTAEPALVPLDGEPARSGETEPQEPPAAAAPSASPGSLPHDLSPWGMYQAADIVVKAVMIGLVIASLITWTVWVAKAVELWAAKRRLRSAIRHIAAAPGLGAAVEGFARRGGTAGVLVRAAGEEVARSLPVLEHADGHDARAGVKERVTSRLSRIEANAGRRITLGTGVLATIGATAPFVGLFGTVWGIMNSFIGISQSQTTNLAVVAPGIAEALLATALGLVAAIPAVIIYNVFARSIAGYKLLLADASAGVERLVSWELDARRLPAGTRLAQAAE